MRLASEALAAACRLLTGAHYMDLLLQLQARLGATRTDWLKVVLLHASLS